MDIPVANPNGPDERPLQIAPHPTAPPSAFSGEVGRAVEAAGQEFGRIAADERMRVSTGLALEGETAYQRLADKMVSEHRGLIGKEALAFSNEYKGKIYALRDQIMNGFASKHAQFLFEANSQRIARFAEAGIDAHTAQQRQQIAHQEVLDYTVTTLQSISNDATHGMTNSMLGQRIREAHDHYLKWATIHNEQDPAEYALRETANVAGAAIGGKARVNPADGMESAKELFKEYGRYLTPEKRTAVLDQIAHGEARSVASRLVDSAERVNGSKTATMPIDETKLWARIDDYTDKHPDIVDRDGRPLLRDAAKGLFNEHEQAAKQEIDKRASRLTGVDGDPRVSAPNDMAYLRIADRMKYEVLVDRWKRGLAAGEKEVEADNRVGLSAFHADMVDRLYKDGPEEFGKLTDDKVKSDMLDSAYPLTKVGAVKALNDFHKIQERAKVDHNARVSTYVDEALQQARKDDFEWQDSHRKEALAEIDDYLHDPATKDKSKEGIRDFLRRQLTEMTDVPGRYFPSWTNTALKIDARMAERASNLVGRRRIDPDTGEARTWNGSEWVK